MYADERGLSDEPRPGVPRKITDADVEQVIVRTREEKPKDDTRWSTRALEVATGKVIGSLHRRHRAVEFNRVRDLRPTCPPADPASRAVYGPGEIAQCDGWFPPGRHPARLRSGRAAAGAGHGCGLLALDHRPGTTPRAPRPT